MKYKIFLCVILINISLVFTHKTAEAVSCDSTPRGVKVLIPGYEDRPTYFEYYRLNAPLIVMMHGKDGCISDLQKQSQMTASGINILWVSGQISYGEKRVWIVSRSKSGYNETFDYLKKSVEYIDSWGLDPTVTVSAGLSMGGTSAIAAVCKLPEVFDGAVSVAGADNYPCSNVDRSLLVVGGKNDYAQGPLVPKIVAERWIENSVTCDNSPIAINSGIIHIRTWTDCGNRTVREVLLDNTGHVWPLVEYNANKDISLFINGYLIMLPIFKEYFIAKYNN